VKQPDAPPTRPPIGPSKGTAIYASSPTTRSRLQIFASLLTRWNSTIRLVSQQDLGDFWKRHIEDALQLAPLMPSQTTEAVDLGSGGGLPGLVLAIATDVHFDLIEADSRKAAFLREAAISTKAPVTIHAQRIEEVRLPRRPVVTARALAPLHKLLELAEPFLLEGGVCLFPKGERVEAEIAEAETHWTMLLERMSSSTAQTARLLRISAIKRKGHTP
jgi:16S rRNA (guanine527-N7)-methyltransferase